jgi:8-oxo-dGTP pyrophosphatase MutT (NUDIX family)
MQRVAISITSRKDGKVLLILRKKPENGTNNSILAWTFPSGIVQEREDTNFTAERETLEETGYVVKTKELINEKDHPQFPVHVYYWACELIDSVQHDLTEHEEIAEVRWVNPDEIPKLFTTLLDQKTADYLKITTA